MIRELEFSYSVASLSSPGVIPIDLPLPDCDVLELRVELGAAMDGGDATFNFTKNGVNMFSGGDRPVIADTDSSVIKSSLSVAMVYGDYIRLILEAITGGTVTVPIMVYVTIDDGLPAANVAGEIHAATGKTTPVDADELGIADSAASWVLKKLTWANLKATLLAYFNTLYVALTGDQTIAGIKTFSSSPIVPTPTTATQAANKSYVDAGIAGLSWKQSVRVATAAAGTLATAFDNGETVDGVTLATGDRILIKNQASATENGIYIVAGSGAPTRATDADSGAELVNASVYVQEGTANADKQFVCTTNAPITIGATNITFAEFSSGSGDVATDAIWDAAGDLAVGSGANTAVKLSMGTALQVLRVNAGATALEYGAPAGGGTVDTANSPDAGEWAKFTDADTIEGRTDAELIADLSLEVGTDLQVHDAFLDDIAALTDPGADRILYWDNTANEVKWLEIGAGLAIVAGVLDIAEVAGAMPTFVATGTVAIDDDAITPGLPAGWAEDDIFVLFVVTTSGETVTCSGYTEVGSSPINNSSRRLTVFWKRATSSESAPTTSDSGDHQVGVIIAIRGCTTTGDPFDATSSSVQNTQTTAVAIPGVTTTSANCLLIYAAGCSDSGASAPSDATFSGWANASLANVTERVDHTRAATSQHSSIGVATGELAVAGASGTTDSTITANGRHSYWCGALKP